MIQSVLFPLNFNATQIHEFLKFYNVKPKKIHITKNFIRVCIHKPDKRYKYKTMLIPNNNNIKLIIAYNHGGGVKDVLKSMWSFITSPFRKQFDKKGRNILDKYGNNNIVKIAVGREPLNKMITEIGNMLTRGDLEKTKKYLHYDQLYHLFMVIYLDNGKMLQLEKTQIPKLSENITNKGDRMLFDVNKKISLNEFILNTVKTMGNNYFTYNLRSNNCQDFVIAHLNTNGLNEPETMNFIKQDAVTLLKSLPSFIQTGLDKTLDLATRADVLFHGVG